MIGIVSYGVGNIRAFANIYDRNEVEFVIADSPEKLRAVSHVVLPGVGSFDWAMTKLNESGLRETIDALHAAGRPILGVCVGMQMMFDRSAEGEVPGLGWIPGSVELLRPPENDLLRLPHMGWNDVAVSADDPLFAELGDDPTFYFLHSYHVVPVDAGAIVGRARYGLEIACAIRREAAVGVQFHPEKSHHWGERVLLNFARL